MTPRSIHTCLPAFAALVFLAAPPDLRATDPWVWDAGVPRVAPAWITSVQSTPGSTLDAFQFHVRPATRPGRALAVTAFYQDGTGGVLRVLWSGTGGGDLLLGDRLIEGVDMLNRRTLLIPAETAASGGAVVVQCDAGSARLKRLAFDWVAASAVYASDESRAPYVLLDERGIGRSEAEGAPPEPRDDALRSRVVAALLQDAPVALTEDPAFQAELVAIPDRVLWECEVANLDPGSPLLLWINNRMAGEVSVEFPDLWDPGWFREPDGRTRHAGWRKARAWVDRSLLHAGSNLFQLDAPLSFGGGPSVRRVFFQAAFDPPPALLPVPSATTGLNPDTIQTIQPPANSNTLTP
ncbi:MAG: hypothetical protein SFU85_06185 [Candidatus Methylacidiphilales bacterium]|nr:hypothetical protein [Candidatus Methylacidiphilales bacterium]